MAAGRRSVRCIASLVRAVAMGVVAEGVAAEERGRVGGGGEGCEL